MPKINFSQNTSVHNKFARDVVGYTLGYFNGDYQSIGSTNFAPSPYTGILNTAISPLYNGNIAFTTTAIADVPNSGIQMGTQMGVYRYDQMNRLVGARTFRASGLAASNSWTGITETPEYASTYSYDANGNLKQLQRNGSVANLNMDKFTYEFEQVNGLPSNRLDYVKDEPTYSSNYDEDIDNQTLDNYGYDRLGQLIRDNSEGLMQIEWFSGNRKVKKITRSGKTIEFKYSPFGQRLLKTVTNTATGVVTTSYYVYDANGQVMGVYDLNLTTKNAKLNELNIYGASRLGMIDRDIDLCINGTEQAAPVYPPAEPEVHTLGYKKYEIVNYLGNVNAVITDRKISVGGTYEAVVIMNSDYYPFGMEMPGRHTNENKYRYGYNGMELDNEAKGNGNSYTTEFRQYDPRLGRWLSLDPLMMQFPEMSPYCAFDNNPVFFTDPLGLAAEEGKDGDPMKTAEKNATDKGWTKSEARQYKRHNHLKGDLIKSEDGKSWEIEFEDGSITRKAVKSDFGNGKDSPRIIGLTVSYPYGKEEEASGTVHESFIVTPSTGSERGKYDGTVIAILPWYQIARGIQDVQAGDNWGWFKIAIEVVPIPAIKGGGKLLTRVIPKKVLQFTVNTAKFDYFFGRVTSGSLHNVQRSAQNLKDLTTLGIKSEKKLMKVFNKAFVKGQVEKTLENNFGVTVVKSIEIGKKGKIDVSFFYKDGNMEIAPQVTTIIPKIFK